MHLSRWLLGIWIGASLLAFFAAKSEVTEVFDMRMRDYATLLTEIAYRRIHDLEERGVDVINTPPNTAFEYNSTLAFKVWRNGKLAASSTGAPNFPTPNQPGFYYERITSYENSDHEKEIAEGRAPELETDDWIFYAAHDPSYDLWVVVAEIDDVREFLIGKMILQMVWPVLVIFPILFAAIYFIIQKQLRPLGKVSRQIGRRSPSELSSISSDGAPAELIPIIASLNSLLARLSAALEAERRFTANASHELRTPLAALITQVQVAERQSEDKESRHVLSKIRDRANRLTNLVDQLMTLARLDPDQSSLNPEHFCVQQTSEAILADLANAALEKNIELNLDVAPNSTVYGIEAHYSVMVRNLVENAIRYSPENTEVCLKFSQEGSTCEVMVTDQGKGIPDKEKKRVFEYFTRGENESILGSGIGLSIVQRVASFMKATVTITDNIPSGTIVTVWWDTNVASVAADSIRKTRQHQSKER